MSEDYLLRTTDTGFDRVLAFSVPARHARGRIVRLGPVLETVLSAHDYPPLIKHLLAEALVLTALMGSLLKEEGSQLTIQAQSEDAPVDLLVCDYRDGEVRGYVRHDDAAVAALGDDPSLDALFGKGYLAITFDLAVTKERYQGVVPLEGASLAHACESYFARSEQIPSLIRVAVRSNGPRCTAGGMLVQHLPEGEEGKARLHVGEDHPDWEHVSILAGSVQREELVDPVLTLEQLVWRLFNEEKEVRVEPLVLLQRGCRCTVEYYQSILSRFPEEERADMRDDDGMIPVDCAFCSKVLRIPV
ncbi:Hsp33 family molecular chaperone HslO [Novosphingobium mangrovi (ex Huang et al. 2023)]|uniref:Hsp33 family molecular chaperone HslO n=1 Tax=Novosphingobium mangrovi (ex Huang et al. 2023) TaxID=2976432 RepID=A0ABT2I313_9SPHN|nr:Hsp33 family molecular chaperone HslO [Novosphingobium mangrovi (ex Huang et al. 2023)]MCT2399190.1 Hsp33 family molecular chaperone HslO [Novosphingobium mangrovi (ex Huang et al. 2023)]